MTVQVLPIHFATIANRDEGQLVFRYVEIVNDPVVADAEAEFASSGHAVVREASRRRPMSPIFAMLSAATFRGSRATAASNSAEKTWVAAPGIRLRAHGAQASGANVGPASPDGILEIRRHFHLVFEPLLQPFPQLLGILHRKPRDSGFNFCDRAHGRDSSFCEFPLQAGTSPDP
jgi:hypothetical protein